MSLTKRMVGNKDNKWLTDELNRVWDSSEVWAAVDPYIHPSGSYNKCDRYIQFSMLGYRGKTERASYRILSNGTYMHLRWTEYFRMIPSFLAADVEFESEEARGSCDIVLKDPFDSRIIVGELKSINPNGYQMLPTPGTPEENAVYISKVYPVYMSQILLYMRYVRIPEYEKATRGFFLFEDKATQAFKIYWVNYDEALSDSLLQNSRLALANTRAGILAPPPLEKTSKECNYCSKKLGCWNLEENKDEAFKKKIEGRLKNAQD